MSLIRMGKEQLRPRTQHLLESQLSVKIITESFMVSIEPSKKATG